MLASTCAVGRPLPSLLSLSLLLLALSLSLTSGRAQAHTFAFESDADEARAYHEKAKAAFALSHYAQAAEFFEKAFELKSDPALLYNAAQSHRLAGNKERALTLYQNYLRVYGRDERKAQIDLRIEELKRAIEHDRTEAPVPPPVGWPPGTRGNGAATPRAAEPPRPLSPPVAPPPPPPVMPVPSATPAMTSGTASPMLLTSDRPSSDRPSEDQSERPLTRKPWFWVVVGGGVVAVAATVLFLTLSGSKDPSASFGRASGN